MFATSDNERNEGRENDGLRFSRVVLKEMIDLSHGRRVGSQGGAAVGGLLSPKNIERAANNASNLPMRTKAGLTSVPSAVFGVVVRIACSITSPVGVFSKKTSRHDKKPRSSFTGAKDDTRALKLFLR